MNPTWKHLLLFLVLISVLRVSVVINALKKHFTTETRRARRS